ncbi:hypothetical protein [Paenibacillus arenilitoris]|uniref:DUF4367 domain-containing protein n=1 Tax=Paenibacillus arenilitoris TaxID=2772299 RepID=A0A927CLT9_9BACL|nr:hypothetical protein [Paenibacillus arenilitoris]MBD2869919.1 hypothetical protein [Paenibacillus arenilitoris]
MNQEERKLRERFKTDADETIFAGMEFDERLKARVRSGIHAEGTTSAPPAAQARVRRSERWALGFITAAAAFLVLLTSQQLTDTTPQDPPIIVDRPLNSPDVNTPLAAVDPKTVDEAEEMFGEELRLPDYVPQPYQLQRIGAGGTGEGLSARLDFTYANGDRTFVYSIDKNVQADLFAGLETVQIGSHDGYIDSLKPDYTTLYWIMDGKQYSVLGHLTRKEAIDLASSAAQNK